MFWGTFIFFSRGRHRISANKFRYTRSMVGISGLCKPRPLFYTGWFIFTRSKWLSYRERGGDDEVNLRSSYGAQKTLEICFVLKINKKGVFWETPFIFIITDGYKQCIDTVSTVNFISWDLKWIHTLFFARERLPKIMLHIKIHSDFRSSLYVGCYALCCIILLTAEARSSDFQSVGVGGLIDM